MNLMKWIQEVALSVGMIIAFGLVLYFRYPRISRGLNKIFKIKSKNKGKKDKITNTDEEIIDLIVGTINRIDDKHTVKDAIKRIRELVN